MTLPLVSYPQPLYAARFIKRSKRFILSAQLERTGQVVGVHLGDPGRLVGVLEPGVRLWCSGPYPPPRKLSYSAHIAEIEQPSGTLWINLEPLLANRVARVLLEEGRFDDLPEPAGLVAEYAHHQHRFDFAWPQRQYLCEVKAVTHRLKCGSGAFPDAPTKRGRGHLQALIEHRRAGHEAALLFMVGRGDIHRVVPHRAMDPAFGLLLDEAAATGVKLLAAGLEIKPEGVYWREQLAVDLG